ncbi:MAG: TerB family tellurite resistance protein [Magnetococcales bacterium]|nr:TerB family tellurite resistance protein [Magnetococcales bacterium]
MAISSPSFLSSGLLQGFRNLGNRVKAVHYRPVMEAFCACLGQMAAADGRLRPAELAGFRRFVLDNHANPVVGSFPADELVENFKQYAIKAFLEEDEVFVRVLDPITPGSEAAQMIITGCLAVAFADGVCDSQERQQLAQLADRLGVDMAALTGGETEALPLPPPAAAAPRPSRLARALQEPAPPKQPMCTFCQGNGCVFCQQTGIQPESI